MGEEEGDVDNGDDDDDDGGGDNDDRRQPKGPSRIFRSGSLSEPSGGPPGAIPGAFGALLGAPCALLGALGPPPWGPSWRIPIDKRGGTNQGRPLRT